MDDERLEIAMSALREIAECPRERGLAWMCNWMRGRAMHALSEIWRLEDSGGESENSS